MLQPYDEKQNLDLTEGIKYALSRGSSIAGFLDEYVNVLVTEIRQDLSSSERALVEEHFPAILEEFALRLGNQEIGSIARNMMHVAHRKRKYVESLSFDCPFWSGKPTIFFYRTITSRVCGHDGNDDDSDDLEDDIDDGDEEDSDEDKSALPVEKNYYANDVHIDKWQTELPQNLLDPTVEQNQPPPPPDDMEEQLQQYHRSLRESEAYSWLIFTARRGILMNGIEPHTMENHRVRMLEVLRKNTPESYRAISRGRKPNQYSVQFELRWDLVTFMEAQQYSDGLTRGAIGRVITLTGDHAKVYATSLRDYMTEVWPSTGPDLVELFEDLWGSTPSSLESKQDGPIVWEMRGSADNFKESSGTTPRFRYGAKMGSRTLRLQVQNSA